MFGMFKKKNKLYTVENLSNFMENNYRQIHKMDYMLFASAIKNIC